MRLAITACRVGGAVTLEIRVLLHVTIASLAACNEPFAVAALAQMRLLLRATTFLGGWENSHVILLRAQGELELRRNETATARGTLTAAMALNDQIPTMDQIDKLTVQVGLLQVLGQVEQHESRSHDARIYFILAAIICRKLASRDLVVVILNRFAPVLADGEGAPTLLEAVMLPLQRFRFRRRLGDALLHSGAIAQRRGQSIWLSVVFAAHSGTSRI